MSTLVRLRPTMVRAMCGLGTCQCGDESRCGICGDDACLLTMTPCRELKWPIRASDGRVYDAIALRDWALRCTMLQRPVLVLPHAPITTVHVLPPWHALKSCATHLLDHVRQRTADAINMRCMRGGARRHVSLRRATVLPTITKRRKGLACGLPRAIATHASEYDAHIDEERCVVVCTRPRRFSVPVVQA